MASSSIVQLEPAYNKLINKNTKLILVGDPGVGKTWMARMLSDRTVKEGRFDFAIWVLPTKKCDKLTMLDVMTRELSLNTESEESNDEGAIKKQNMDEGATKKQNVDEGATKKQNVDLSDMMILGTLEGKKILDTLEKRKVLFIVDNDGKDSGAIAALEELSKIFKASLVKFLITSTANDMGCEDVIEVGPLSEDEALEKVQGLKDEIGSLARSFIKKRRRLPTDMIILEKIFHALEKSESGLQWLLQNVGSQESYVIEMLYKGNCLLPRDLLIDLCVYANVFLHRESLHYNELIAYWMLEGSLGHFDCIEYAYEKGHAILLELLSCGLIKELENGYVVANKCYIGQKEADSFLSPIERCAFVGANCLGLRTVFDGEFGRIVQTNGMMRTLCDGTGKHSISALLVDANRLNRDIPDDISALLLDVNHLDGDITDDLLQSKKEQANKELEIFALFDPTFESLPMCLFEMHKLRLVVLRRCKYLKSIEEIPESEGQSNVRQSVPKSDKLPASGKSTMIEVSDADNKTAPTPTPTPSVISTPMSYLPWLTVLEISGPSFLKSIPDFLFTSMPSLRSINFSHLDIKMLPSTFYALKEVVCLILQGCLSLVEFESLKNLNKLQVLDLSGATSFIRFHDRNFSANQELRIVNLYGSQIKSLPILHHLKNLKYLLLKDCTQLRRLPKISELRNLEILDLSGAKSFEVFHEPSLGELEKLKVIRLSETAIKKLPLIFGNPNHLCLKGCKLLKRLSFIEPMKELLKLDISDCSNLEEINELFFSQLTSLQDLNFSGTKVETLPSLSSLTNLHRLSLSECFSLKKLDGLNSLSNLEILDISHSVPLDELHSLGEMFNSSMLAKLDISSTKINSLPSLSSLGNLQELILENCTELVSLPSLEALSKLEVLNLSRCNKLENMGGESFDNMSALRILDLSDTRLKELPSLSKLEKLNYLSLRNCNHLVKDPKFGIHSELKELDLSESAVKHLPTGSFANLLYMNLQNCPNMDEFHAGMDKIFPLSSGQFPQFPYKILSLEHLELLVLPLLEAPKENLQHPEDHQEKSTGGQWQLSYWPELSADHTLQISMSSSQFLRIFGENKSLLHTVLENYRSVLHPVEVKNRYLNEQVHENQVVLRDSYTKKLAQDIRKQTLVEQKGSSLEVRDFTDFPEGIGSALHEAKNLVLKAVSVLKCLTDFGSENVKEMEFCWAEKCINLESLLPVEKEKSLDTTVDSNKDVSEVGKSEGEITNTSASDSGSISSKMLQSGNFGSLKRLHLEHCPTLSYIGLSSSQVRNLEVLQIKYCESLKSLFEDESAELPRLQKLHLWGLPEINNMSCKMPLISTLDIGECAQLEHIDTSISTFEKLIILRVRSCDKLKSIFSGRSLDLSEAPIWYLWDLPNLVSVGVNLKMFDSIHVRGCPKLIKKLQMEKKV